MPADDVMPMDEPELVSFDRDVHPILVAMRQVPRGLAPALPDHGAADEAVSFAATQAMSNDGPVSKRSLERLLEKIRQAGRALQELPGWRRPTVGMMD
jgi:hypothetical protein